MSALALLCAAAPAWAERRVALVIGNSAYVNANPLANPANDASDMAAKLENLGFEVTLGLDLDKQSFDAKVRAFSGTLENADAALLFYAGHGLQIGGRNFLVPIDAKLERERDVEFETVSLDFVLKQMELNREAKTNIVLLDACRNNPLARNLARSMGTRSTSLGSGLAEAFAGVGTFISYSTQPGNVALDGQGRNSPFASALLKHSSAPGRSLTSVMIDVRKDVVAATDGKQVPWDHSALTGEFFFIPPAAGESGENGEALQNRVRALEEEVKTKTQSANAASNAALVQLRQRVSQMNEETRRDWEKVFQLQRQKLDEADPMKLGTTVQEIGRLQIGIVKRSKDQEELKGEIAELEKNLGIADPQTSSITRDVTPPPAAPRSENPPPAPSSPAPQTQTQPQAGTTAAAEPPADAAGGSEPVVEAVQPAPETPAPKRTPPARRKKSHPDDPDWNMKAFSR